MSCYFSSSASAAGLSIVHARQSLLLITKRRFVVNKVRFIGKSSGAGDQTRTLMANWSMNPPEAA